MQFPIPNNVLEPYIRAAVATAITGALGDGTKLVEQAVQAALTTKVSAGGVISNASYENTHLLADVVSKKAIQKVAHEVINEMAETMRPRIKAEIEKQLATKHGAIAKAMVDGLLTSLKSTWSVHVSVEAPKER